MVSGHLGNLGDRVHLLVVVVANHGRERVATQHQAMGAKPAWETIRNLENAVQMLVQVC